MRVFTQRMTVQLPEGDIPNNWGAPTAGAFVYHDELLEDFEQLHPNSVPTQAHALDYTIISDPIVYVIGRYWGDESKLEAAIEWSEMKNENGLYTGKGTFTTVLVCEDSEHPTALTTDKIFTGYNDAFIPLHFVSAASTVTGYWLASDPDTFTSTPEHLIVPKASPNPTPKTI